MTNMSHAVMWKKKPKAQSIFVSCYMNHVFPILKGKNIKKVLDVACGNGLGVTLPLLRRGYRVWCFDHFMSGVHAVKRNATDEDFKVNAKKTDMYKKFPYPDNFFDASFCFQAIYHGRLEQIMFTISEMKRVTKKGGLVFMTFLPYEGNFYDKKRRKYFMYYKKENCKIRRSYMKPDKSQPHMFYFLQSWEHGTPHYFISRDELKAILPQFLKDVKIKQVKKQKTDKWFFWLAYGTV